LKCDTIHISMFVLYVVLKLTYCDLSIIMGGT